jgi:isoleucyl-tRNA synthetase
VSGRRRARTQAFCGTDYPFKTEPVTPTMDDFVDADVGDQYDPHAVEERVFDYWEAVDAYERTVEHREGGEEFFFVDGPPYTSGSAHMGHAWNKSLKDVYIRYKRMCGFDVSDRPGYDMHGLPIETKVEAEQGFENKKEIQEFGIENFIEACRAFAEESLDSLQSDFKSFGVWMDWENPYKTVTPEYMEAAWWAFEQVHERGLVERGKRSINQCPRCETAIANNEVEYHDAGKPSVYAKFPLRDREGSLVIWTTTPWTIVANTFVAVDEELSYVGVDAERDGERERLYVAEDCVEDVLSAGRYESYEVVERLDGAELVGWEYDHPLAEQVPGHASAEGSLSVYGADYVEADRTGLVHSAPGHGEEDFERGQELGLEVFCPVGSDGVFTDAAGAYAGTFVRDANDAIVDDLAERDLLLASEAGHTVREGQCWRCDTDIVRIVTDQWFITVTDVKEDLLANVEEAEWYPEWARENRFRDFVEDAPDWNVSRQRYWGIPIPIWLPSEPADSDGTGDAGTDWDGDMDDAIVVGTRGELAERVDQDVDPDEVDLHKPTVDGLTITEDGTTYERVPDVFDVWLDSSVATWGTLDYPGEPGSEADYERLWPADLIIEAHDQTRGWFWSQLGMGTAAVGEVPYERVMMHGHALMPDGRAMSKSRDITIAPEEVIEEHGADPMRLFLLSMAARGDDMRVSWEEVAEMERRLNILWNAFRFPLPYMEMDGFDPAAASVADADLETIDRWLLSRLQTVEREATEAMESYEQDAALDAVLDFVVEDVSRYYIQVVRERMWEEADTASKRAAYATLSVALREAVALLAPFAPFVTEEIYQRLTGEAGHPTVHMCDWPDPDADLRDADLEARVDAVRAIEEAGSQARQDAGRKLRWPVARVVVDADDESVLAAVEAHRELLADRLNARAVDLVAPGERWDELAYTARADMSVLGPAFGDDAGAVMEALNAARVAEPDLDALDAAVEDVLDGRELTAEMVEFVEATPESAAGADFEGGTVYVDAALTEDIESEGYAREVIRRVQEMRKDLDLAMDAEIRLETDIADDRVADLVARREALVREEVRAAELGAVEDPALAEDWEIEGVDVHIAIRPLEEAAP